MALSVSEPAAAAVATAPANDGVQQRAVEQARRDIEEVSTFAELIKKAEEAAQAAL